MQEAKKKGWSKMKKLFLGLVIVAVGGLGCEKERRL